MPTLSANEIFKKTFEGRKLINTKIVNRGKVSKDIAYELAQDNVPYSDYSTTHLTIVSMHAGVIDTSMVQHQENFANVELAKAEVARLKTLNIDISLPTGKAA